MKKIWKFSFIFLLVLCAFAPIHFTHALDPTGNCILTKNGSSRTVPDITNTYCTQLSQDTGEKQSWTVDPGAAEAQQAANQAVQNANPTANIGTVAGGAAPTTPTSNDCGLSNIPACFMKLFSTIAMFILTLMSFILWVAGCLLDWVLKYTITELSDHISSMTGINIVWKAIRDLANIAFIFILLYESIRLIISQSSTEKIKGVVAGIVITALLINFSMFFTKVIIDASNIVTVGFYQSIVGANPQPPASAPTGKFTIPPGISGAFINDLHVVSFITGQDVTKSGNDQSIIMIGLGGSILFLILSFVFFAISIMFLIRYLAFIVLLMSAPLGYLGFGLPGLKGMQSQWWNTLIGQCVFAPLWMFCAWAILMLVGSPGFLTLSGGATLTSIAQSGAISNLAGNGGTADPSGIPLIVNFGLVIGLVIGSLVLAKQYASQGSKLIGQATGKLTTFAGGAIMGTAAGTLASASRNTFGRAGNAIANSDALKERASKGGLLGIGAKGLMGAGEKTAKSSFDIRGKSGLGLVTSATGVNIGKAGGKGGFEQGLKDRTKAEEDFAKKLKPSDTKMQEAKVAEESAKEKRKEIKGFEKEEKDAKDKYLESDEYKKTDVYKNAEKEKAENEAKLKPETENQKKLDGELKGLEKERAETGSLARQKELDDQITVKKQEITNQKKKIEDVKKEIAKNNAFAEARKKHEDEWMTDKRKILEKEAGEFEKTQKDIEGLYSKRVESYAGVVENKFIKRYAMMTLGGAAGAVVGGLTAGPVGAFAGAAAGATAARSTTKSENRDIAIKIKKLAKEKSNTEKLADLAAKVEKEKKDKEEVGKKPEESKPESKPESGGAEKPKS